jgi:hypothetical protein
VQVNLGKNGDGDWRLLASAAVAIPNQAQKVVQRGSLAARLKSNARRSELAASPASVVAIVGEARSGRWHRRVSSGRRSRIVTAVRLLLLLGVREGGRARGLAGLWWGLLAVLVVVIVIAAVAVVMAFGTPGRECISSLSGQGLLGDLRRSRQVDEDDNLLTFSVPRQIISAVEWGDTDRIDL